VSMRRLLKVLIVLSVLQGLSMLGADAALSQSSGAAGCRYFPATGHNIQAEFLTFFDRFGGASIFGQPCTEAFVQDGLTVQYFERGRMELHPSNPAPYRVQLTLTGELLGYRQPAIPSQSIPPFSNPQRRYYPQTGHTLSYVFLRFYDTHGGLDIFGYPITEMVNQDGLVVQYFQRGKMEWHPENPISSQVTLGSLGDEYIARTNLSSQHLTSAQSICDSGPSVQPTSVPRPAATPVPPPTVAAPAPEPTTAATASQPPSGLGELGGTGQPTTVPPTQPPPVQRPTAVPPATTADFTVSANVKYLTTGQGGTQTVYVRVLDSKGSGVGICSVMAIAHVQPQDVQVPCTTDAEGFCSLSFNIGFPPAGYTVMIEVRATHAARTVNASTSFLVW